MLILNFLKHSKLKLFLAYAVVEFVFHRAVYIAILVALDLILDSKMAVSLVLISRRDLLDRRGSKMGLSLT